MLPGLVHQQDVGGRSTEQFFDREVQTVCDELQILVEQPRLAALERNDGRPPDSDLLGQLRLGEAGAFAGVTQIAMEEILLHSPKLLLARVT